MHVLKCGQATQEETRADKQHQGQRHLGHHQRCPEMLAPQTCGVGSPAFLQQFVFKCLLPVLGDRIQLHQVVLNLIVNGFDAVAERPMGDRWVSLRTAESDGGVELTVKDSGKGIAEGDLARVFEPFFSTKPEGLGMGLAISQSIVKAHGGWIWAENREGHGVIFHCMLPVAQQGAVASAK